MDIAGWEHMYRTGERGSEDQPTRLLLESVGGLTPGNAIDLACGTGRNALFLAELGWTITAVDGSKTAIEKLKQRAAERGLKVKAEVCDLTSPGFTLPDQTFDLVVIAYYLQRDLFAKVRPALHSGGIVLAIVHTPEPGEKPSYKRAAPGELQEFFADWDVLYYYEGASRDPAHHRPVAEIVARKK
jgi:tellurite methyltransferase